ncbi:hypothetical protein FRC08_002192 [Ceratobasidium sp. 394]|nr:hypothetical protein FRC08_002192 [Ceratobasidium sp. 394]
MQYISPIELLNYIEVIVLLVGACVENPRPSPTPRVHESLPSTVCRLPEYLQPLTPRTLVLTTRQIAQRLSHNDHEHLGYPHPAHPTVHKNVGANIKARLGDERIVQGRA